MNVQREIYVVVVPSRYGFPLVKKTTKRKPALKQGEVSFCLQLQIPSDIFSPPAVDVQVNLQHVVHPAVKAKTV